MEPIEDLCTDDGKWDWLDDGLPLVVDEPDALSLDPDFVQMLEDREILYALSRAATYTRFLATIREAADGSPRWEEICEAFTNSPFHHRPDELSREIWRFWTELGRRIL